MIYNHTMLQDAIEDWLSSVNWNVMITLTYDAPDGELSTRTSKSLFGKFVGALKRETLGKNSKRKIPMVPVVEFTTGKLPHIHVLLNLNGEIEENKALVRRIWTGVSPLCGNPHHIDKETDKWYLPIKNQMERGIMLRYVTKTCRSSTDALLTEYMHLGPTHL